MMQLLGLAQTGLGPTGAANTYATTMEPKAPGDRLSAVDDWKNRMSSGALVFTKQIWSCTGL